MLPTSKHFFSLSVLTFLCLSHTAIGSQEQQRPMGTRQIERKKKAIEIYEAILRFARLAPEEKPAQLATLITQYPELISTPYSHGFLVHRGQSFAQLLLNDNDLTSLEALIHQFCDHCTAAIQPSQSSQHPECFGATPFLSLCFKKNVNTEQQLCIIMSLAAQNPHLVVHPRDDGITPAMAAACSGNYFLLPVLYAYNEQAFQGHTKGPKESLASLIASAKESAASAHALVNVLTTEPTLIREAILMRCASWRFPQKQTFTAIINTAIINTAIQQIQQQASPGLGMTAQSMPIVTVQARPVVRTTTTILKDITWWHEDEPD